MARRRIFVSCGQITQAEHALSDKVIEVIGQHGMQGFLARTVHSANGLNAEVFENLRTCDVFVAIMHGRGEVNFPPYSVRHRGSVWIQQEIAILSYRMYAQGRPIPMRVYAEPGILLEGVMAAAIINPIFFTTEEEVLKSLADWLKGAEFLRDPVAASREMIFAEQTKGVGDAAWEVLSVLAALTVVPGDRHDYPQVQGIFDTC